VLQKLGVSYLALGNSIKAIERFSEADQIYAQVGDHTGMGAMQRLIGRSYFEQGDRAKALDHYQSALSLLEQDHRKTRNWRAPSAPSLKCT
jgi:tetratricopeptide (TPR) repeat protein